MPARTAATEKHLTKNSYRKIWSSNCCYKVSYNSGSRRLWGSSICMTLWVTCLLVVGLSFSSFYFGIIYQIMKPDFPTTLIVLYCLLLLLNTVSLYYSLRALFDCAQTEPGILPGSNYFSDTITSLELP